VSAGINLQSPGTNLGFDSHFRLLMNLARVHRQGPQRERCIHWKSLNIYKLTSQHELDKDPIKDSEWIVMNAGGEASCVCGQV